MPQNMERFEMRLSALDIRRVDDWRRSQPDSPSRGAAIRILVNSALQAHEQMSAAGPDEKMVLSALRKLVDGARE